MKETKHTPAPWMVSENERNALAIFPANDKGRPRALCSIAFVQSWNGTADDKANAQLIAAAPELLEALEVLVGSDGYEVDCIGMDMARAAIAKATKLD